MSVIEYLTKRPLWVLLTFETIADHKLSNSLHTQNLLFDLLNFSAGYDEIKKLIAGRLDFLKLALLAAR